MHVLPLQRAATVWKNLNMHIRYHSSTTGHFKVLFFGRDEFSCLVLREVLQAKDVWRSVQVVTQPDAKTGRRGSKLSISPLKLLAEEANLAVYTIPHERSAFRTWTAPLPFSSNELSETSHTPSPEYLLVTASFGRILPNSLLNLFHPTRRLNVHPSLLPAYRGPAPIQHALMGGNSETGVCVIEMTERKKGIDSGDIWASERMRVPEDVTFPTLRDTLARTGGRLLVAAMRDILAGKDTRIPQPGGVVPRAPLITAEHAMLDFKTMTASHIVRIHRAISHQRPMTAFLSNGRTLQLHKPSVFADMLVGLDDALPVEGTAIFYPQMRALIVRCADSTYLSVPEVRQQDRHLLKAKEWWNGVKPEMRLHAAPEGPVHFVPPAATQ